MTDRDQEVFAEVFDRHRQAIHAFLLGRMGDRGAAADLLQETFLRCWRRLGEVAPLDEGRQRAWLFTVARNLTVDAYRAEATRQATTAAVGLQRDREQRGDEPSDRAVWREQLDLLDEAVGRLPEEQRVILSLATVAEMTSRQIAEALGEPAGTVRYRLHQARTRLAAELDLEA